MDSIRYGNLRIDLIAGLGGRVELLRPGAAAPWLAPAQPAIVGVEPLDGRDLQMSQALAAAAGRQPMEIVAPCGYGKTALLRHVAARLGGPAVYLTAGDDGPADLLHRLVGAAWTVKEPVKLSPGDCLNLLRRSGTVAVLDELTGGTERVVDVLNALSGCGVVIASDVPRLQRPGRSVVLSGLTDVAAATLLRRDLGRPITASEAPVVRQLVAAVHGRPLALRQAAALVRTHEHTFVDLAARPGELDRLSLGGLSIGSRRVLACLALLAGAALPGDLVSAITGLGDVTEALGELRDRGFVEQRADRFGLPVCRAEGWLGELSGYVSASSAAREIIGWLAAGEPGGDPALSAASAALSLIKFGAGRLEWDTLVQLIRVAEPVLALAGRWETCQHLLDLGVRAAQATGDPHAQAFCAHEQGTLALCEGRLDQAQAALVYAVQVRDAIGDRAGADLSRHNLSLLGPAPVATTFQPPPQPPRGPGQQTGKTLRRAAALVVAVVGALVLAVSAASALLGQPDPVAAPTTTTTPARTSPPGTKTRQPTSPPRTPHTTTGRPNTAGPATGTPAQPTPRPPRLTPVRAEFGSVNVAGVAQRTFVVTNPGDASVTMAAAQLDSDDTYSIDDGCHDQTLAAGAQCRITVTFAPASGIGKHTGTLTVADDGGTDSAALDGTGFASLTVTVGGSGAGTVTSDDGRVNCPTDCSADITAPITLTAQPSNLSTFIGFGGACTGRTCEGLQIKVNDTVTATFQTVIG